MNELITARRVDCCTYLCERLEKHVNHIRVADYRIVLNRGAVIIHMKPRILRIEKSGRILYNIPYSDPDKWDGIADTIINIVREN